MTHYNVSQLNIAMFAITAGCLFTQVSKNTGQDRGEEDVNAIIIGFAIKG